MPFVNVTGRGNSQTSLQMLGGVCSLLGTVEFARCRKNYVRVEEANENQPVLRNINFALRGLVLVLVLLPW